MLRNFAKATFCFIIFFLAGCSKTSFLISNESNSISEEFDNIEIKGDVYYKYSIKNELKPYITTFNERLKDYKIIITLEDETSRLVSTESKIIKDFIKIKSNIEIKNNYKETVFNKTIDSISTYEVEDTVPFANIASQNSAKEKIKNEIIHNIYLLILDFLHK